MAKIVTALVVKYRGGYLEVDSGMSTYGRREALVSLDVGTADEALAVATQLLGILAAESSQFTCEIFPTVAAPGTRPVFGFNMLDYISIPNADLQASTYRRVMSYTITEAADGVLSFVPEMGVLNDLREEEIQRTIRRMLIGSLAGTTDAFGPTEVQQPIASKHQPALANIVFSFPGELDTLVSPRWRVLRNARATKITLSLDTAGSSTTTIVLLKNGATWHTLTGLTSGTNQADTIIQDLLAKDDYIQASITVVGTGAADLTVQIDVADESSPPPE